MSPAQNVSADMPPVAGTEAPCRCWLGGSGEFLQLGRPRQSGLPGPVNSPIGPHSSHPGFAECVSAPSAGRQIRFTDTHSSLVTVERLGGEAGSFRRCSHVGPMKALGATYGLRSVRRGTTCAQSGPVVSLRARVYRVSWAGVVSGFIPHRETSPRVGPCGVRG